MGPFDSFRSATLRANGRLVVARIVRVQIRAILLVLKEFRASMDAPEDHVFITGQEFKDNVFDPLQVLRVGPPAHPTDSNPLASWGGTTSPEGKINRVLDDVDTRVIVGQLLLKPWRRNDQGVRDLHLGIGHSRQRASRVIDRGRDVMRRDAENDVVELRDKWFLWKPLPKVREKLEAVRSVQGHPDNHVRPTASVFDVRLDYLAVVDIPESFPLRAHPVFVVVSQDADLMPFRFQIAGGLDDPVEGNPGDFGADEGRP